MTNYPAFSKIPRLYRDITITEKIDGTNALISVDAEGNVRAGSRTRWITPEDDNFGFARWVHVHQDDLKQLGEGLHYGEWWGVGIQRHYNLSERRFSLFMSRPIAAKPDCCGIVPTLYSGPFAFSAIEDAMQDLRHSGSKAATFDKPEGIIVFHKASRQVFKILLENDEEPKGKH